MFAGIVLQSVHHQNIVSDQEKTPTNSPMKTKQASKCSFKYYLGKSEKWKIKNLFKLIINCIIQREI